MPQNQTNIKRTPKKQLYAKTSSNPALWTSKGVSEWNEITTPRSINSKPKPREKQRQAIDYNIKFMNNSLRWFLATLKWLRSTVERSMVRGPP